MATETGNELSGEVRTERESEVREPRLYRVLLLNDDYTTMEFVIDVLVQVFRKSAAEATRIMLDVHRRGRGLCGVYTRDIAATKAARVHELARRQQFPLRCDVEEA